MVKVRVPDRGLIITDAKSSSEYLSSIGIIYDHWDTGNLRHGNPEPDKILDAYSKEIDQLKREGGYTTADVIDIDKNTPGLEAMLERFRSEHTHDEDEVRFTVAGRGIFHIHPENADVVSVEVEEGDLIRVPKGTKHWFDLCEDRHITAIRLFQNISGWTPYYTNSGEDKNYQPVCFGPAYIPSGKRLK
ncbi:cupin domain-containing protein [Oxyplasma meridianum]|uniref:acireductone dioxygenase (Fe(2+)-requiring) n=1 Tax=Oxyplasma meridianum TaxID=3073602 RepID=A0AAX4NIC0_9ARCH